MNDRAFLQAIFEAPDDDGPRLIFADWLEDRGDGARAEFIRTQCELARLPADAVARRRRLEDRERDLLVEHQDGWRAALPAVTALRSWGPFVRGFVEEVTFYDAADFVECAERLFAALPLRRLRLTRLDGRSATPLARLPELSRLTTLEVLGGGAGTAAAQALAASPHVAGLTRLALRSCGYVRDAGAEALASSRHLARLERLDLHGNSIGPKGVRALLASRRLSRLTALGLGLNDHPEEWLPDLVAAPLLGRLTRLDLESLYLGTEGLRALTSSPRVANLTELSLDDNGLDDEGAAARAAAPHLGRLAVLNLAYNDLSAASVTALAGSPHLTGLRELVLDHNDLGDAGARALAKARRPGLIVLSLEECGITAPGLKALADSPLLAGVRKLVLWDNVIGPAGAKALAASAYAGNLEDLELTNGAGPSGARALAASATLGNLARLNLCHDGVQDAGAKALAASPTLPRLRELLLHNNGISDAGARALAESPYLGRLLELELTENPIGEEGKARLRQRFGSRVRL